MSSEISVVPVPLDRFVVEAWPLLRRQWEEFEAEPGATFEPDLLQFVAYEERDAIRCLLLKQAEDVIGHAIVVALEDAFSCGQRHGLVLAVYVEPEHRSLPAAIALIKAIRRAGRDMQCRQLMVASRHPSGGPDLSRLLQRAGYRPCELWYRCKL